MTADMVKKTVQMMNEWAASGKLTAQHEPDSQVEECMSCHKENQPYTQAKEQCMNCHGGSLINVEE